MTGRQHDDAIFNLRPVDCITLLDDLGQLQCRKGMAFSKNEYGNKSPTVAAGFKISSLASLLWVAAEALNR